MTRSVKSHEIPLETFSKVVEAVYDCALDPKHWQTTIRLIAEFCRSQTCILGVYDYTNRRSELAFNFGYTQHYIRLMDEKYKDMDPHFTAGQLVPVGTVITTAMILDSDEFYQSRFFREWCKPQGLHDFMGFKVLQTGQRIGFLSTNRASTLPRYGETDVRLLSLLAPHICRAVVISDALNLKTIRSEALEATFDALACGVYLVDGYGRIMFMNRAAVQQVKASNSLQIKSDRLAAVDSQARTTLTEAIEGVLAEEAANLETGFSVALPAREGAGLVATILPLYRGERRNLCGAFAAKAAIFVQDPIVVPPFPGEAFAKLYSLTGSELRVLLAMAPGLSVKEAAEVLGIGETTAKTHLQHIFGKTGTSKQTELMRLFMSSTPPVRAA